MVSGLKFEDLSKIAGSRPDGFIFWHMPSPQLAVVVVYSYKGELIDVTWNGDDTNGPKSLTDD